MDQAAGRGYLTFSNRTLWIRFLPSERAVFP
jgi:hypothetical protein